jgi:hypothetical protein
MLAYNFIYIMILLESSREDREVTIPPLKRWPAIAS